MTDTHKLDVRTAHRYIQREQLTQEEFEKHLASLVDVSERSVYVDYERQFREEEAAERAKEAEERAREAEAEAAEAAAQRAAAAAPPAVAPVPAYSAPAEVPAQRSEALDIPIDPVEEAAILGSQPKAVLAADDADNDDDDDGDDDLAADSDSDSDDA